MFLESGEHISSISPVNGAYGPPSPRPASFDICSISKSLQRRFSCQSIIHRRNFFLSAPGPITGPHGSPCAAYVWRWSHLRSKPDGFESSLARSVVWLLFYSDTISSHRTRGPVSTPITSSAKHSGSSQRPEPLAVWNAGKGSGEDIARLPRRTDTCNSRYSRRRN